MGTENNSDPDDQYELIREFIQVDLGYPVEPSWNEALKRWKGMCKYLAPRTSMFVIDMKQRGVAREES